MSGDYNPTKEERLNAFIIWSKPEIQQISKDLMQKYPRVNGVNLSYFGPGDLRFRVSVDTLHDYEAEYPPKEIGGIPIYLEEASFTLA